MSLARPQADRLNKTLRLNGDVKLGPVTLDHAAGMLRWMRDPEVAENVGLRKTATLEQTHRWIEQANADPDIAASAILFKNDHVGNVVLDRIDHYLSSARLSVYVGEPSCRGLGVATTAVYLLLQQAFRERELNKVWLTVHQFNSGALSIYKRLGFIYEGVLREEFILQSVRVDAFLMSILRDEFVRMQHMVAT